MSGSNEYPHSMFLNRNKKNNVYPCKPQFYYIKVGFKGVKIIYMYVCFPDDFQNAQKRLIRLRVHICLEIHFLIYRQTAKSLPRLHECAGWSKSLLDM